MDGEELCVLSRCEHPYLAKFLVERGADVNRADRYRATPLYHACSNPNEPWGTEMMNALLDAGADVDAKTTVSLQRVAIAGETALSTSLDWFRREREHRKLGLSFDPFVAPRPLPRTTVGAGCGRVGASGTSRLRAHLGDDINKIYDPRGDASDASDVASRATDKDFIACKKLIADERRRRYLLPQRKEILRSERSSRVLALHRSWRPLPSTPRAATNQTASSTAISTARRTRASATPSRRRRRRRRRRVASSSRPHAKAHTQRPTVLPTSVAAMRHNGDHGEGHAEEPSPRVLEY